jgi:hypothetical protein
LTAHLLIGPVLRRVVGDRATIWVETTAPARVRVEVTGGGAGTAQTFSGYGHHYAIVIVSGLVPGTANEYRCGSTTGRCGRSRNRRIRRA